MFAPYFLEIIYQDENIIAVNKPAGVNVHPDEHHKSGALIQELAEKFPEIKEVGDNYLRPGVVHRLDKDTSGILIVARNQDAFYYLKSQFKERKIKKTYLALVYDKLGKRAHEKGIIDLALGRSAKTPILRVAKGKTRGKLKEAITEYKIIRYFNFKNCGKTLFPQGKLSSSQFTLVEVYPKTGRTHQIRAHFKAIGHPIVCDRLYGGKQYFCPFGLKRHFLHAFSLEFTNLDGARLKLEADLAEDLQKMLQNLKECDKK